MIAPREAGGVASGNSLREGEGITCRPGSPPSVPPSPYARLAVRAVTDIRCRLSALMAEIMPGDLNGVLFPSGGAEANEVAVRIARRYTGKHKILTLHRSYHGASSSTIAATGDFRRGFDEGGATGFIKAINPSPMLFGWGGERPLAPTTGRALNLYKTYIYLGGTPSGGTPLGAAMGTPPAQCWLRPLHRWRARVPRRCSRAMVSVDGAWCQLKAMVLGHGAGDGAALRGASLLGAVLPFWGAGPFWWPRWLRRRARVACDVRRRPRGHFAPSPLLADKRGGRQWEDWDES